MASINFNFSGENWFKNPIKPITPINLLTEVFKPRGKTLPFASISSSSPSRKHRKSKKKLPKEEPGMYLKMLQQYLWESENKPDYRHTPEVEKILKDNESVFETKENPTTEEVEENEKWWNQFRDSPVTGFLRKALEIADKLNDMELQDNSSPYHSEDRKYWKQIPHVIGPDGRPMPRKSIKTREDADDKFWDFAKQFFFGLWGFKQRHYPSFRPIDVAQSIGYKNLERRYHDFIMKTRGWYYKDRMGRTRGPMELIQLKTAWAAGMIDTHTFIWGQDMDEWVPVGMIYGMESAIATWEVRFGAASTAFLHKLQNGISPWAPLKGQEVKTYQQLQDEAYENKRRDLAVLQANHGLWPGVKIPSHCHFLWASGSELTSLLEEDHMPNKYISVDIRKRLQNLIPGLRPWEVLSVEQAMDIITYGGKWNREPLGRYTTGPPYIQEWNLYAEVVVDAWAYICDGVMTLAEEAAPGFREAISKWCDERDKKIKKRKKAQMAATMAREMALVAQKLKSSSDQDQL